MSWTFASWHILTAFSSCPARARQQAAVACGSGLRSLDWKICWDFCCFQLPKLLIRLTCGSLWRRLCWNFSVGSQLCPSTSIISSRLQLWGSAISNAPMKCGQSRQGVVGESQLTSEMGTGIDCWIVRRRVGIRTMILLAHPFSINSLLFVCASQLDLKCLLQVSMSWNPEGWQVFCYYLPRQEKGAKMLYVQSLSAAVSLIMFWYFGRHNIEHEAWSCIGWSIRWTRASKTNPCPCEEEILLHPATLLAEASSKTNCTRMEMYEWCYKDVPLPLKFSLSEIRCKRDDDSDSQDSLLASGTLKNSAEHQLTSKRSTRILASWLQAATAEILTS